MVVDIVVPLAVVLLTLLGGWFVTTRVTDRWDQIKRRREIDLTAAQDFQQLYGEFFAIWKAWNTVARHHLEIKNSAEAAWDCLNRAANVEGRVEALLAKISAERELTEHDIAALGGVRQGFQSIRLAIKKKEPLNWWASEVPEYAAFKGLAAYTSRLIGTSSGSRRAPAIAIAAANFRQITSNKHEKSWVKAARELGVFGIDQLKSETFQADS